MDNWILLYVDFKDLFTVNVTFTKHPSRLTLFICMDQMTLFLDDWMTRPGQPTFPNFIQILIY